MDTSPQGGLWNETPPVLYKLIPSAEGNWFLPLYQQPYVLQPLGLAVIAAVVFWVLYWKRRLLGGFARPILFVVLAFTVLIALGALQSWKEAFEEVAVWSGDPPGITGWKVGLVYAAVVALIVRAAHLVWRSKPARPDDKIFELVALELEASSIDKGLWARLYARYEGDESKTRAAYIRTRVKMLSQAPTPAPVGEQEPLVQPQSVPQQVWIIGAIVLVILISLGATAFFTA